ncbi:ATP-binding cassette domain-containing protein [Dactylosporangium sp. NPDC049525]|uniref:ATP-binding cassette domain-containing protein n=1 Tax=Dactylosporangium sp. NPDC049525 TaxID=3154730 RepID=UPI003430CD70
MSSLLLILDDAERRLPEQDPHYLWMDAGVLKVSTNPPNHNLCVGHFVSEFGEWWFHSGPAECPSELRINGRPVDEDDVELSTDRAEVRLSAEPYSEPPRRNWEPGPATDGTPPPPPPAPGGDPGDRVVRYVIVPPGAPPGPETQLVVDDPEVVPGHAWIEVDERGAWWVTAHNGQIFVDGQSVASAVREPGTRFTVGRKVITVPGGGRRGRGLTVECSELSVRRGGRQILDNVSMSVPAGDFVAVFSPDPAGAQMLLGLIVGGYRPDHGAVHVGGSSRRGNPAVRWVSATDDLHGLLTVRETLAGADAEHLEDVLSWLGLTAAADLQARTLNDADRKRLCIARELIARPALLVLFEAGGSHAISADRDLMSRLATVSQDTTCTVVVAAGEIGNLDLARTVVVLDRQGRMHYAGPGGQPFANRTDLTRAEFLAGRTASTGDSGPGRAELPVRLPPMRSAVGPASTFDGLGAMLRQQWLLFRRRGNGVLAGLPVLAVAGGLLVFVPSVAVLLLAAVAVGCALVTGGADLATARAVLAHERRAGVGAAAVVTARLVVHGAVCAVLAAPMALWAHLAGEPAPGSWWSVYVPVWLAMILALSGGMLASVAIPDGALTPTNLLVSGVVAGSVLLVAGWLLLGVTWLVGAPALLVLAVAGAGAAATALEHRLAA